jgi:hypothetical protein
MRFGWERINGGFKRKEVKYKPALGTEIHACSTIATLTTTVPEGTALAFETLGSSTSPVLGYIGWRRRRSRGLRRWNSGAVAE